MGACEIVFHQPAKNHSDNQIGEETKSGMRIATPIVLWSTAQLSRYDV